MAGIYGDKRLYRFGVWVWSPNRHTSKAKPVLLTNEEREKRLRLSDAVHKGIAKKKAFLDSFLKV